MYSSSKIQVRSYKMDWNGEKVTTRGLENLMYKRNTRTREKIQVAHRKMDKPHFLFPVPL